MKLQIDNSATYGVSRQITELFALSIKTELITERCLMRLLISYLQGRKITRRCR